MAMNSDTKTKLFNPFQKLEPVESFWNWNNDINKKTKNINSINKRKQDEKRFSPTKYFTKKEPKERFILGPGAGAGVGCGAGFGFGLVGGVGYSGWGWNHLQIVMGFGAGCGVGVGFGFGQGVGQGSSWEAIKEDFFGKKKKSRKSNRLCN